MKAVSSIVICFFWVVVTAIGCKPKLHPLANDEIYTCPHDVHVLSDKPGKCPNDNMDLVKQRITDEQRQMMRDGTYTKAKN